MGSSAVPAPLTPRWRWTEGALIVLFWSLIAVLSIAQHAFDTRSGSPRSFQEGEILHTFLEFAVWAILTPGIFWMSYHFTPKRIGWLRTILLYVLVGVAVTMTVEFIEHFLWNTLVPSRRPRPMSIAFMLRRFHFMGDLSLYGVLLIAGFARVYFLRYHENQQEAIRLRMEASQLQAHLADARLRTLRMQINPHFLFNTLHIISDNFESNPRNARRMIARLSEILRYTFQESEAPEVTLAQELQFINGYLDIQRFRFEDNLVVTQDIAPDVRDALIPNLILQPLVENAIKHGVSQHAGVGHLELRAWHEADTLYLRVQDNGPGLSSAPQNRTSLPSNGVGLQNTRERLQGLYGTNQALVLESLPEGGLAVTVSLPYHTRSDFKVHAVEEA